MKISKQRAKVKVAANRDRSKNVAGAKLWSAAACCRFCQASLLAVQFPGRWKTRPAATGLAKGYSAASKRAGRKRQQAAALQSFAKRRPGLPQTHLQPSPGQSSSPRSAYKTRLRHGAGTSPPNTRVTVR